MKKATVFFTLALAALILFVSCGEDPFFHDVTVTDRDKVTTEIVFNGNEYTLPANSDAEFLGWKVDDDKYIKAPGEKVTVNGDVAVKAIYTDTDDDSVCLLVYVLTDPDGNFTGSFTSESAKRAVVPEGEIEVLKAKDVTCEGAEFDGWYTAADADGNRTRYTDGDTLEVTKFTKLYANWIDNNLSYTVTEGDEPTVTVAAKVKENVASYGISSWYQGKKVTVIGESGFSWCTNLTSITLPDTIKTISRYAFSGCSKLTSCNLPDGLETIEENVFRSCDLTGKVVIPSSVTSLGDSCFHENKNLTSIEFEAGCQITEIPYGAFWFCGFTSFPVLPTTVTKIQTSAFHTCKSITVVDIPDSVTEIGNGAFAECSALEEVNIGTGIAYIHECAFCDCTNLVKISIKKSAEDIRNINIDQNGFAMRWSDDGVGNYNKNIKVYDASGDEVTASSGS